MEMMIAKPKKQLTPEIARMIQQDIYEHREPFVRMMADIYARSTFTITMKPRDCGSFSENIYPTETEEAVKAILSEADAITISIINTYRKEYGLTEI